ncbi:MAG: hypothetical protein FJW40_08405 [Acidobacteria bacterium]|nr:hypothetical protein [Acidobacteriota bacterium]
MGNTRRAVLRGAIGAATLPLFPQTPGAGVTLVRFPYLQNVRPNRAAVLWTTREAVENAAIWVSADRTFGRPLVVRAESREFAQNQTNLPYRFFQHQAEITGLQANTQYFYRAYAGTRNLTPLTPDGELNFRTAPETAVNFRFTVFGDSGAGTGEQSQLALRMMAERPSFSIHTGDLVYPSATYAGFQAYYFDTYRDLFRGVPSFPCPGNHDYDLDDGAAYLNVHSLPSPGVPPADRGRYYSFDWGNAHFVSLDSNLPLSDAVERSGGMLQWLDRDLTATSKPWKIAFWHHTPYATGTHENDPLSRLSRQHIIPILEKHGVQLVFGGHEHAYERTRPLRGGRAVEDRGIVYVTSGGGGAGLYAANLRPFSAVSISAHHYVRVDATPGRLTLTAVKPDGTALDQFNLAPGPAASAITVVNSASYAQTLAPGGIVSVFGENLAFDTLLNSASPLAGEIAGTRISLAGYRMPLYFVSPRQINAQVPFEVMGPALLRLTTPNGQVEVNVTVEESGPGIFVVDSQASVGAILHTDGRVVDVALPARPGEFLQVFVTGLGRPGNGSVETGHQSPASPPLNVRNPVVVHLGETTLAPAFAGLAPGFTGLNQVNFQVPADLAPGSYEFWVNCRGRASNRVTLRVG